MASGGCLPASRSKPRRGSASTCSGPNGSGKTTLLRVIAGLLPAEAGQVACNGRDTRADRDAWCAAFSYLAHSDGLKPELTARENLAFERGLRRRASPPEKSRPRWLTSASGTSTTS